MLIAGAKQRVLGRWCSKGLNSPRLSGRVFKDKGREGGCGVCNPGTRDTSPK